LFFPIFRFPEASRQFTNNLPDSPAKIEALLFFPGPHSVDRFSYCVEKSNVFAALRQSSRQIPGRPAKIEASLFFSQNETPRAAFC